MRQGYFSLLKRLALILLVLITILVIALIVSDVHTTGLPPLLFPIATTVFISIISLIAAFLAARSFLSSGAWPVVLFGAGLLAYGTANLIAGWMPASEQNVSVTVHNSSSLLAACLFLILAIITPREKPVISKINRQWIMATIYGVIVIFITILTVLALQDKTPPFFIPGTGPTLLRQIILGSSAVLFTAAALYFLSIYRRSKADFLYWCTLGLGLISLGFIAIFFVGVFGDAINWLGRFAQYLGSVYLGVAILVVIRETRQRESSIEDIIADFLHYAEANYHLLVDTAIDAIVLVDTQGRILMWNKAAENMFGYNRTEAIGKLSLDRIIIDPDYIGLQNRIQSLLLSEEAKPSNEIIELQAQRENGEVFPMEISFSFGRSTGRFASTITLVMREITERKLREANLNFLNEIERDYSRLSSPEEIMQAVGAKIGAYLNVETINFCEVDDPRDEITVIYGWRNIGAPDLLRTFRMSDYYSEEFKQASRKGDTIVIRDTQTDPRTGAQAYALLNIHSFLSVPFLKNREWKNSLTVTGSSVRDWRQDEIDLFGEISERIFPRIERARIEEALRQREERFRILIQNLQSGVALIDESGCFIMVNISFLKMFGLSENSDILNVNSQEWSAWQVLEEDGQTLLPLDEHPVRKAALTGKAIRNQLVGVRLPSSGALRWLLINAEPIIKPNGKIQYLIATYYDITERKKAEEALIESEQRFRLAQEGAHVGTFDWNILTGVNIWTPQLEAMYGLPPGGFAKSQPAWENLVYPDDREKAVNLVKQTLESGVPVEGEWRVLWPNGTTHWISGRFQAFKDSTGKPIRMTGINIDITDRKKVEEDLKVYAKELESANKELEAFSYSVSHDLRSPLRTLDGFSEAVLADYGDKLDETGKDYLNRIRKASQTMAQLIDDILKLSRISRAEMHQSQINLSDMAKSITDELRSSQMDRPAEIMISPNLVVKGDKSLLEIGLRNLLENAWKYTSKNTSTRIEFGSVYQNGERVYIVKDNGIGFDMQYKDKLFQPFQRLHTNKEYPGMGIGLATVQRVIRRHNGRIWAESEVSKGTTFYFTLG